MSPYGVTIEWTQNLYRSSWSGWRFVGQNTSYCDSYTHDAGQPYPQCHPGWDYKRMQAYVWWNCAGAGFQGGYYNYRQTATSYIQQGGNYYYDAANSETGPWYQSGNTLCQ